MKIANPKPAYDVAHFVEDFEAKNWLNQKFDEGYIVDQLKTAVVSDSRDRRKQVVEITIIVKLDLPNIPTSSVAPAAVRTLRDIPVTRFDCAGAAA